MVSESTICNFAPASRALSLPSVCVTLPAYMALWWLGSVFDGFAGLTSVSGPLQQDVWRDADFDAIPVPSFCKLPKEEVQRIQRNFLGRPVMQHGSSSDEALQQLRSKGYSSWKEYLLQVEKCSVFSCSKLGSHCLYQPGSQFE